MKTGHNPTPLEGSCLSVAAATALVVAWLGVLVGVLVRLVIA